MKLGGPLPSSGSVVSRVFTVKPNKKYTLSAWVKAAPGQRVAVTMDMVNTYTPPDGYPARYSLSSPTTVVGDTWQRVSFTGYLLDYPTSDYNFTISGGVGGAVFWLDDIQLEEGDISNYQPSTPIEVGARFDQISNIFFKDDPNDTITDPAIQATITVTNNSDKSLS